MIKSLVDMSRPHMLYAAGLGFIMLASLAITNIPGLSLSHYIDFERRREICAGLFILGTILGVFSMQRHLQRSKLPWKVPQSQVSLPYLGFFVLTLLGLFLAK